MKMKLIVSIMMVFFFVSSCKKQPAWEGDSNYPGNLVKIAVVSDIHYTDPGLFTNNGMAGTAFQTYLNFDPKLLEYSDPIFRSVLSQLTKSEKPDILLVPGDLTKDGEKISHESVARLLDQLRQANIKVYVVPGNHDVNNPQAMRYDGDNAYSTASVSASEFSTIYSDCGYGNALTRDPNSLSYIAQPFPNLWILALDDCKYYDNKNSAITGGVIKEATMSWALSWMAKARQQHIRVLGLMHHGLMEHYAGQNQIDPGYVTDYWEQNGNLLMKAGLKVMFTGHYHANDISKRVREEKELFDVETGSMVMPPSPYRIIKMNPAEMNITTKYVTSISANLPGNVSFPVYSTSWMSMHLEGYFKYVLSHPPYSVPAPYDDLAAPFFRKAFMAHFAGDEQITPDDQANVNLMSQISPLLGGVLQSAWTDLQPADNKLIIKLPK